MFLKRLTYLLSVCLLAVACAIENDIPYPIKDGSIASMEVEGQCGPDGSGTAAATINKNDRTVSLYVDDTVDLTRLRITRLTVSDGVTLIPDSAVCVDFAHFPSYGFESLDAVPLSADTRVNFSSPVRFLLRTYQDYPWTVSVSQVIKRELELENQVGEAVVDEVNRSVVIYVSKAQPLTKIKVNKFTLGGVHGTVIPDPTTYEYFDFSQPVTFFVSRAWEEASVRWTVYVYQKESSVSASVFSRSTDATISGTMQSGKTPVVEYRKQGESSWTTLAASAVRTGGTSFTATLSSLAPGMTYQYRVTVDTQSSSEQSFTTAPATPLTDGDFDNWNLEGKLWSPWKSGGVSFWDTGNKGATTVGNSNSVPTDDTCNGSGQAAYLESKYIVIKFAAGNIFTGSYVKTDGTNGVLSFGREFHAFPSKLRVNYKCDVATINRTGDEDYAYLKGRPDSCHIYIALTDWSEPLQIRTRPSERQLFERNDPHVIAYAELIKGETVSSWQQVDLPLTYRYTNRTPNYILVVASASKYGDFFTGGEGSKLWIDNFELIYD